MENEEIEIYLNGIYYETYQYNNRKELMLKWQESSVQTL